MLSESFVIFLDLFLDELLLDELFLLLEDELNPFDCLSLRREREEER